MDYTASHQIWGVEGPILLAVTFEGRQNLLGIISIDFAESWKRILKVLWMTISLSSQILKQITNDRRLQLSQIIETTFLRRT